MPFGLGQLVGDPGAADGADRVLVQTEDVHQGGRRTGDAVVEDGRGRRRADRGGARTNQFRAAPTLGVIQEIGAIRSLARLMLAQRHGDEQPASQGAIQGLVGVFGRVACVKRLGSRGGPR